MNLRKVMMPKLRIHPRRTAKTTQIRFGPIGTVESTRWVLSQSEGSSEDSEVLHLDNQDSSLYFVIRVCHIDRYRRIDELNFLL
jgi:hypothetical protein